LADWQRATGQLQRQRRLAHLPGADDRHDRVVEEELLKLVEMVSSFEHASFYHENPTFRDGFSWFSPAMRRVVVRQRGLAAPAEERTSST